MILTLALLSPPPRLYLLQKGDPDEIEGLCKALHIITKRDTDGTVTTVIRTMLTKSAGQPIGSSELADLTHLKRVTIIHHLKRLLKSGLVRKQEHKYVLCPSGFLEIVRQKRAEAEEMFDDAERLAKSLDSQYHTDRNPIILKGKIFEE